MKFFPIKVAIICLLATPLLYNLTLISCEKILNESYTNQIENILIGDSKSLLNGTIRLEEQIASNIHDYLIEDFLIQKLRLKLNIIVTNDQGKIIYPIFIDLNSMNNELGNNLNADFISKHNFELLNSGLNVNVQVQLGHGSLAANIILIIYFGISLLIFLIFYRVGISKAALAQQKDRDLLSDLQKEEQVHKQILDDLKNERQGLFENIKALNARYQEDSRKAKLNEEEMFDEIVSLEEQINSYIDLKRNKDFEIEELKTKIQKYERRRSSKGRRNEFDFISKRFIALYKNILMTRKALSGFLSLNEDQQIKAEELIVMLDRNPENVTIKRKVFSGKKHRTTCFEVLFAYNGRLYFKKNENNSIEVLVIGTKNTQSKDMDFIHKL